MKIYTKIILDKNNNLIKENFFEYNGGNYDNTWVSIMTLKTSRSAKLMEKQAKRKN